MDMTKDESTLNRPCTPSFTGDLPEVKHPDDFIVNVIDLDTAKALTAIGNQRRQFHNPAVTAEDYLERFRRSGLIQASHRLQPLAELF